MKLENQVCSLSQAKRLKELGVVQKQSMCEWEEVTYKSGRVESQCYAVDKGVEMHESAAVKLWDAYTVAELGVMLPSDAGVLVTSSYYNDHMGQWYAEARNWVNDECELMSEEEADTEAEARAALLIWLLESGHITAEQVNHRLQNA